jgi:Fe-S-cluster containining protein
VTPLDLLTSLPEEKRLWFERRLQELYSEMDAAYGAVASGHGFRCTGCSDNCCLTRFHHHTLAELALLQTAFSHLPKAVQKAAAGRARAVLARYDSAEKAEESPRVMCPVNLEQRCLIYDARPMICRMHGVPHVLRGPGRPPSHGPGCAAFSERCDSHASGPVLDRTPFYQKMAALEKEMRTTAGFTGRIHMTVAEMVVLFCEETS